MDREKLIIDNEKLIYFVLKKRKLYNRKDDLYDIGMIGLVKGAKNYDATKGIKPSTYLAACISNEIGKEIRKEIAFKRQAKLVSLDNIIDNCDDRDIYFHDVIPDENINIEEDLIQNENKKLMYNAIEKLSERDKFIICSLYGLNGYEKLTQRDISKKLGVSQTIVSRKKNKIIAKIKKYTFN